MGIRYRIKNNRLFGSPDLILPKYKTVVFVDGDFWHGFNWKVRKEKIKTNKEYWLPKIERNIQRDSEVTAHWQSLGWMVVRFWEHQIRKDADKCVEELRKRLIVPIKH